MQISAIFSNHDGTLSPTTYVWLPLECICLKLRNII